MYILSVGGCGLTNVGVGLGTLRFSPVHFNSKRFGSAEEGVIVWGGWVLATPNSTMSNISVPLQTE